LLTPTAASESAFAEPDSAESPPALTKSPATLMPVSVHETELSEAVQAAAPSRGTVPDSTGVMEGVRVGLLGGSRVLLTVMTVEPSRVGRRGTKGSLGTSATAVSGTNSSKEEKEWPGAVSPAGRMAAAEMLEAESAARCEPEFDAASAGH